MSSSDSSDDEEEAKKISQAIVPNDLLASLLSSVSLPESKEKTHSNDKIKTTEQNGENVPMKSRRPDKNKEDDDSPHGYFLTTTPEFRAHIEKHLTKILDRELDANLHDSVWNNSNMKDKRQEKGINLFSDVKVMCLGETESPNHHDASIPKNRPKIQPRKHRLRSSSDSSEDEEDKILSCVFTVDDIEHENRMLENLSKTGVDLSGQDSKGLLPVSTDNNDPLSVHVKKKGKTPIKSDTGSESHQLISTPNSSVELVIQNRKKRKKARMKDAPEAEVSPVLTHDFNASPSPNDKKKKKICIDDGQEGSRLNCKTDRDNEHVQIGKKKKKKRKCES